ncbi:MAG: ExeA family protein [Acidobacteriota bacterium]|nr:MAG: ExeA family protein [Acidobacteriota bacterium]
MYEAFFGFREKPFNLTPDPKFLYLSAKHNEAFAHLEYGLEQRGGFMAVTGEVGTGKTTLCRYFLERLDDDTLSAFILYPALGTTELLRAVNKDLGISAEGESDKELIDCLHEFLLESRREGKNIVLVIDEAQNLSRDVLEQVRLISNLETDTEKLIQIVLIGQSELNDILAQTDLRQLAQRVTARYHLTPLTRQDLTQYIRHRLAVAGGIGKVDFTPGALRAVHRYSKGIPRLINLVCDRALLAAFVYEKNEITGSIVRQAVKELEITTPRPWYRRFGWGVTSIAASMALVLGVLSLARVGIANGWSFSPGTVWAALRTDSTDRTDRSVPVAPSGMSLEQLSEHFELRLITLSEELSRRASSAVLLERWGIRLGGGLAAISALEDMPSLADRAALQYAELETSFAQLRALNVPAILEVIHPSRDRILYVTLTGLHDDDAVVYFAPGDFYELPIDIVKKFWSGRARVFWRDFDELESADGPSRLVWARGRLKKLGLLDADADSEAVGLQMALQELQKQLFLEPTGSVGHETRLALYSLGGDYRMPYLMHP